MRRLLLYSGGGLVGVAVLGTVGALVALPRHVQVERSILVKAPACNVHAVAANMARFNDWSPWADIDPSGTTYRFEGPAAGVGAMVAWSSEHPDVGTGSMTITASDACARVVNQLDFGPNGQAVATLSFAPEGEGTRVAWGFESDMGNNPIGRVVGTMMDGMLGPDFEEGLANLKGLVESLPTADVGGLVVEEVEVPSSPAAIVQTRSSKQPDAVGEALGAAYGRILATGLESAGAPMAAYTDDGDHLAIDAILPLAGAPDVAPSDAGVTIGTTPSGRALKVVHQGAYEGLEQTIGRARAWAAIHGRQASGPVWEEYISDPAETPAAELITHVYIPIGE